MSNSHSPEPPQDEEYHESDVVSKDSFPLFTIIEESPNQNYPYLTKSQDTVVNGLDNSEDDENTEQLDRDTSEVSPVISSGMPSQSSLSDVEKSIFAFCAYKGKKGKGKGRLNLKKQQILEKKLDSLMKNLNPVPFAPAKMLDFSKHEQLLRKLGLWDFVNINFDKKLRKDMIAQLIATYESRCSYVNGIRIGVNRADLARAFKMPTKKDKSVQVDLDFEPLSEDSIVFLTVFVSDWMFLHDDTCIVPNEVLNWLKVIKDGHPEKVDWAGLIWFMVEKELAQGDKLEDCYYASHLQHLMKEQNDSLKEELKVEAKEVEAGDVYVKVDDVIDCEGPSIELTLGQDGENEEKNKDVAMIYFGNQDDNDYARGINDVQRQWVMQSCNAENSGAVGEFEGKKFDQEGLGTEGDEETGEKFHDFQNDDTLVGDGFNDNFLEAIGGNMQINNFPADYQINSSHVGGFSLDMGTNLHQQMVPPPFFKQEGKRVMTHQDNGFMISDSSKRMRINNSWNNNPTDFGSCLDNMQQMLNTIRISYEKKEQDLEESNLNYQIISNELQKRDNMLQQIHTQRFEETQEKDQLIYRYERELQLMGSVLDGYRQTLKNVQHKFALYRERAKLHEEAAYKDAGPGGLMLSSGELEKIRVREEEEYKMNCSKVREFEEHWAGKFEGFREKVEIMDNRLMGLESGAKELRGSCGKQNVVRVDKAEVVGEPPSDETVGRPADV